MKSEIEKFIAFINEENRFLLTSHQDPDGDSIGSLIGLGRFLRERGKDVIVYNDGSPPDKYRFLDPDNLIKYEKPPKTDKFNCAIVLDCPRIERIGFVRNLLADDAISVNIDHHRDNTMFGRINIVDESAAAVGEMLCEIMDNHAYPISREVAVPLYAALLSDTGGFRFANTTAACLRCAARLVEAGAEPKSIFDSIYSSYSIESLRLLGTALENMVSAAGGRICAMTIAKNDLDRTGARLENSEGFVDYTMKIPDTEIGILLKETGNAAAKVSLRSKGKIDVSAFALKYGGGGHREAAGFSTVGPLGDVLTKTIGELKRYLDD